MRLRVKCNWSENARILERELNRPRVMLSWTCKSEWNRAASLLRSVNASRRTWYFWPMDLAISEGSVGMGFVSSIELRTVYEGFGGLDVTYITTEDRWCPYGLMSNVTSITRQAWTCRMQSIAPPFGVHRLWQRKSLQKISSGENAEEYVDQLVISG